MGAGGQAGRQARAGGPVRVPRSRVRAPPHLASPRRPDHPELLPAPRRRRRCRRDDGVGLAAPQVGVNVRLMVFNEAGERGKGDEVRRAAAAGG